MVLTLAAVVGAVAFGTGFAAAEAAAGATATTAALVTTVAVEAALAVGRLTGQGGVFNGGTTAEQTSEPADDTTGFLRCCGGRCRCLERRLWLVVARVAGLAGLTGIARLALFARVAGLAGLTGVARLA